MSKGQQEQLETAHKRLRIWLKIGVEVTYVVAVVGFGFLLFEVGHSNQWSLANWTIWILIALGASIFLGFGAARNAVDKIGKPSQAHPSQNENTSKLDTYHKVKADLSARYKRAKEEGKY